MLFIDRKHIRYALFLLFLCLVFLWLFSLRKTDSFLSIYILFAFLGIIAGYKNIVEINEQQIKSALIIFTSILFSISVIASNYHQFFPIKSYLEVIKGVVSFIGGGTVAFEIILFLFQYSEKRLNEYKEPRDRSNKSKYVVFLAVFFLICFVNFVYLFFSVYPGNLTPDSISQMRQILIGEYTNHHPFWHTMLIKVWITVGMRIFGSVNAAVATYSSFMIIFMAFVFSFMIMTLYEMGMPKWPLAVMSCLIIISPYNIAYSVTMWKDVAFGGVVAAFITALLRILVSIGKPKWNYLLLILSGFGFCLWRSNGMFAFAVSLFVFFFVLWKKNKKILYIMTGVLAISFVLKHPVLRMLHVEQPDTVEFLSIPEQQVARVIADGKPLTEEEKSLLSQVVVLEEIPSVYKNYTSDPIKYHIREHNPGFFSSHKKDFLKLWLQIGLRYPEEYVMAWIDQTKGYWNGGYEYCIWYEGVFENVYDIERTVNCEVVSDCFTSYFDYYYNSVLTQPFKAIGFAVWISIFALVIKINRKDIKALLEVPGLAIILSLLISTPVFSEFRYAYAIFTALPMIILPAIFPRLNDMKVTVDALPEKTAIEKHTYGE